MARTKINLSLDELLAELKRRQRKLPRLQRLAATLEKRLAKVHGEIAALGGTPSTSGRAGSGARRAPKTKRVARRARNKRNLTEMLVSVLSKGEPKSVPTIIADVRKAGYKSTSKNFSTIVYQALARDKKRVVRTGRGLYQLKD